MVGAFVLCFKARVAGVGQTVRCLLYCCRDWLLLGLLADAPVLYCSINSLRYFKNITMIDNINTMLLVNISLFYYYCIIVDVRWSLIVCSMHETIIDVFMFA